jgi:hypothetical protein
MLGFNLFWTFSNVPVHVAIGIVLAVLLNIEGLWAKSIYRAIYILPIVIRGSSSPASGAARMTRTTARSTAVGPRRRVFGMPGLSDTLDRPDSAVVSRRSRRFVLPLIATFGWAGRS